ncbi:MAG: hypothetical protein D3903_13310, partial [Candidatus Electrothrix sp. GM3_4]|nr:hypothetical protein [Candidatus Electrothrix sp. GM3_4]
MKRLKTQVSRADFLRLLAVSRTASADAAAKLLGYRPEQGATQAEQKKITRSSIASHARSDQTQASALKLADAKELSQELPLEAFWYLLKKRRLKKTIHRLTAVHESASPEEGKSILPGVLGKITPLSAEELFSVPEFILCPNDLNESSEYSSDFQKNPTIPPPCTAPPKQKKGQRSQGRPALESDMECLVASCSELASFPGKKSNQRRTAVDKKKAGEKKALRFHLRLRRLLGFLSVAASVDPALLQEIVYLLPCSIPDIATEAALQLHPDIEHDNKMYLSLRS